ncbi:NAT16 [Branchiostoma lanceolatum]|uniref:NAT16 protein n=1 Tax=Branchiostoma lanceolatum TaxID=7740 RepID=A0A8J9W8C8_BRALA|nr:NAT16 [Branchiostoma lanceolatum]
MSVQVQGHDQDVLAKLKIRDAMHVDYDAVLTLESGRHGYDCLPALYHRWVDDPAVTLRLAWTEEKVLETIFLQADEEALLAKLEDLQRPIQSTVSTIKSFKNMDMKRMLADEFASKILPERTVLDDTDPYSFSLPNMKTLEERKCYILVDRSGPAVRSLSVGGSYATSRGTVYYFAIHCKDRQLAKSHVVLQMKHACGEHRGNVTFIVTVKDSSLTEDVASYCKEAMGLKDLPYGGAHELLESRSLVWEEKKI